MHAQFANGTLLISNGTHNLTLLVENRTYTFLLENRVPGNLVRALCAFLATLVAIAMYSDVSARCDIEEAQLDCGASSFGFNFSLGLCRSHNC
jgi:hypothetical protein